MAPLALALHYPSSSFRRILGGHICGSLMLSTTLSDAIHLFSGTAFPSSRAPGRPWRSPLLAPCPSSMALGHDRFHRATPGLVGRPPVDPRPACQTPYSLHQCWPMEFSALIEISYLHCPTWRPPASVAAKLSTMKELIFQFSFINFHGSTGPVATLMNKTDLCHLLLTM